MDHLWWKRDGKGNISGVEAEIRLYAVAETPDDVERLSIMHMTNLMG